MVAMGAACCADTRERLLALSAGHDEALQEITRDAREAARLTDADRTQILRRAVSDNAGGNPSEPSSTAPGGRASTLSSKRQSKPSAYAARRSRAKAAARPDLDRPAPLPLPETHVPRRDSASNRVEGRRHLSLAAEIHLAEEGPVTEW
uniref:Uncharacterized protein n=1 Tax=Noctiluca scintillans TaxID=2966 RepID=A0A7S1AZK9_NOCSC|mmetsp:Transcript_6977/g.19234  ORF Transcript_6977/g.19234 Transcript_6977/m.19234 type:complete len:149 (+) Transcript_6977:33-479(+)